MLAVVMLPIQVCGIRWCDWVGCSPGYECSRPIEPVVLYDILELYLSAPKHLFRVLSALMALSMRSGRGRIRPWKITTNGSSIMEGLV